MKKLEKFVRGLVRDVGPIVLFFLGLFILSWAYHGLYPKEKPLVFVNYSGTCVATIPKGLCHLQGSCEARTEPLPLIAKTISDAKLAEWRKRLKGNC